jgi:hypothetical protein
MARIGLPAGATPCDSESPGRARGPSPACFRGIFHSLHSSAVIRSYTSHIHIWETDAAWDCVQIATSGLDGPGLTGLYIRQPALLRFVFETIKDRPNVYLMGYSKILPYASLHKPEVEIIKYCRETTYLITSEQACGWSSSRQYGDPSERGLVITVPGQARPFVPKEPLGTQDRPMPCIFAF